MRVPAYSVCKWIAKTVWQTPLETLYVYCMCTVCVCVRYIPPFHTGTQPGLYPSFGIHTGTLTRVLDPACEQGFDPVSRPAYVITVS